MHLLNDNGTLMVDKWHLVIISEIGTWKKSISCEGGVQIQLFWFCRQLFIKGVKSSLKCGHSQVKQTMC